MATSIENPHRELGGHVGAVNAVRFTPDGGYCISCGDDRSLRLWNPHKDDPSQPGSALLIKSYTGVHGYQILDVAAATDNSKLASGGGDKTCFLWDVSSGRVIRRFQGHNQRVNAIKFNSDGTLLFSGSYDKTVQIWDLRSHTRDPLQILTDSRDSVTALSLTRTEIIVSSVDGCVRVYDLRTGRVHTDGIRPDSGVVYATTSYDQRCVLSVCLDSTLCLSDISTGNVLQTYSGHKNSSYKIEAQFTSDDGRVVTGSEDGQVFFYDLVSAATIRQFAAHRRGVSSISYHPSEKSFLTASYDGSVRLWQDYEPV